MRSAAWIAPLLQEGIDAGMSASERLSRFGRNYLHACYQPGALALQRIAIADGARGLGPLFADEITERAVVCFVDEFTRLGSRSPREDAEAFLGSVLGKTHERMLLGAKPPDLDRAIAHDVQNAMRLWTPYLATLG